MGKFKLHFIINCICFTYIILFICLLEKIDIFENLTVNDILSVFIMTTLVQVIMYFTNKLPINNLFLVNFIRIFDIFIIVFPLGYYFKLFDFSLKDVLIVSIMNISVFLLVNLIALTKSHYYACAINEKINKRMSKRGE